MGLFRPDLFRSFALGFALGALALFAMVGSSLTGNISDGVAPSAQAAASR